MASTLKFLRGNAANLAALSVAAGEPVFTLDDGKFYIGDGTNKVLINPIAAALEVETQAAGSNNTKIANTAFVKAAIDAVIDSSPGALDTLNELAAALGNDANFASTITTALGLKAPLASPALTGTPTAPTATLSDNTTAIATTAFVKGQAYAPLASPTFTGAPAAPTAATGDDSTKIATTAFVKAQGYLLDGSPLSIDCGTF